MTYALVRKIVFRKLESIFFLLSTMIFKNGRGMEPGFVLGFIILVTCVRSLSDLRFADYLDLVCSRCGVRGVGDCQWDFCFRVDASTSSPTTGCGSS